MFIYKISVNGKDYYGMDTKPVHKQARWTAHQQEALTGSSCTKLYTAMRKAGVENCVYSVVEEGFKSIPELAQAEINYIKQHDTYRHGLNGTIGGDGMGCHNLNEMTEEQIASIKHALSVSLSEYNTKIKWAGVGHDERKKLTSHLHTPEVYAKKSSTLALTYKKNQELRKNKGAVIKKWRGENPELWREQQLAASLAGAAKTAKKLKVEFEDGTIKIFNSKSEYAKLYGHNMKYIIKKTQQGESHKGRRAWEI